MNAFVIADLHKLSDEEKEEKLAKNKKKTTRKKTTKKANNNKRAETKGLLDNYVPVVSCIHQCKNSNVLAKQYETLNLLLHNNHYYTIIDQSRTFMQKLRCFACRCFGKS